MWLEMNTDDHLDGLLPVLELSQKIAWLKLATRSSYSVIRTLEPSDAKSIAYPIV